MKQKRIKISNIQTHAPVTFTIVLYLLADKFNNQILFGVLGTLAAIIWIGYFLGASQIELVDLFKEEKGDKKDGSKKT